MISSSQRPLPDSTQQSQQTNIHAPSGIRTHDLSRRATVYLRLRPRGLWDRRLLFLVRKIIQLAMLCKICHSVTLFTTNPTCNGMVLRPGLRDEMLTTGCTMAPPLLVCSTVTLFTTNPTRNGMVLIPGLRAERLTTLCTMAPPLLICPSVTLFTTNPRWNGNHTSAPEVRGPTK